MSCLGVDAMYICVTLLPYRATKIPALDDKIWTEVSTGVTIVEMA